MPASIVEYKYIRRVRVYCVYTTHPSTSYAENTENRGIIFYSIAHAYIEKSACRRGIQASCELAEERPGPHIKFQLR